MKRAFSRKNIWEQLPQFLKRPIGHFLGLVPLPALLGGQFRENYRFVQDSQWWSADKIQSYQMKTLQRLCFHANKRSSYYQALFQKTGFDPCGSSFWEEFHRLPLLTRDDVNHNLEEMLSASPKDPRVDYVTTGGTSGVPLRFYADSGRSAIEYAYLVSSWERVGYAMGDTLAVLRGRQISPSGSGIIHEYDPLLRNHYYSSFHMNDKNLADYIDHISGLGRCYLHVYPSSASALARFVRRSGRVLSNIEGIIAESENVYEEQRQMIEEVFQCRMFSSYGHSEKLVAAAECEESTDYHVWPTYGYCELLDTSGQPVTEPGEVGEIVGSGFINWVTPFIRYRTGDFAEYVADSCKHCNRNHLIVKNIRGHNIQEVLISRDRTEIPWSAVNMHDDTFDNVLQFQFRQDSPGHAYLKIRPAQGFTVEDRARLTRNLMQKFDGLMSFEIQIVENIALSKSGKSIFVDQNIDRH